MRISVIIPVLNEKEDLPQTLRALEGFTDFYEIIVVDAASTDGTREWLSSHLPSNGKLVDGPRGRGNQLNAGGRTATGDVVLFLHADTRLPANAVQQITDALAEKGAVGGGFCVRFRESRPWILRVVEAGINLRTRLFRAPTGDQAIFSRQNAFIAVGGFAQWPIFEDVDFVHRLKRLGRFAVLPSRVATSARRYIAWGVWRTMFLMYASPRMRGRCALSISHTPVPLFYREGRCKTRFPPKCSGSSAAMTSSPAELYRSLDLKDRLRTISPASKA